ncbi:MAG: KTSC domain-containing protein [Gemmatimonadaceae bacterium]
MDRVPVESKSIRAIGYDSDTRVLEIEFRSGGVYDYADVPVGVYEAMLRAESKATFFRAEVRERFQFTRIGEVLRAD